VTDAPEFPLEKIRYCAAALDRYGSQYSTAEKVWGVLRAAKEWDAKVGVTREAVCKIGETYS
jgi:hypothetical protein